MSKLVVGLTGGIASGKSKVSKYFKELNIDVIDADLIARNLFEPNSPHLVKLKSKFGTSIFHSDGSLDRKSLGSIVFSDADKLAWLNQLTHPLVAEEIVKQLADCNSPYVILDIPLLIKPDGTIPTYLKQLIHRVLIIEVTTQNQIQRVTTRDSISEEQAKKIMANQASADQRRAHADDVIDNNGCLQSLKTQVLKLHEFYLSESMS